MPDSVVIDIEGDLQIWDVTKLESPVGTLRAPELVPGWFWFSTATSPDGRWLAAGHAVGSVSIWNLATSQLTRTLGGHTHFLRALSFSPDGTRLATANMGGKPMKLWELEDGEELLTLPGEGFAFRMAAHSRDGQFLMAYNRDGALHLWSAPSWEEIAAAEAKDKADGLPR
jgi:WD40 repeat protein